DDVEHGEHRRPDSRAVGRGVATRVRRACRATGRNGRHQPTLSAIRAFTSFRTSEAGSGLSEGKRTVPLLVEYAFNSFFSAAIGYAPGKNEQCFDAAANQTSILPSRRNAGT